MDKNRDLWLVQVRVFGSARKIVKMCTMIQTVRWSDESSMLAAMGEGKINIWYYPNAVYVDRDMLHKVVVSKETR